MHLRSIGHRSMLATSLSSVAEKSNDEFSLNYGDLLEHNWSNNPCTTVTGYVLDFGY